MSNAYKLESYEALAPAAAVAPVLEAARRPRIRGTESGMHVQLSDTASNANLYRSHVIGQARLSMATLLAPEPSAKTSFYTVQAWEGVVESVEDADIYVRVVDKTDRSRPESFATISKDEIDQEDLDLVKPGAIFYWMVGYETKASGKKRSSFIRFRRSPAWTKTNIQDVEKKANELLNRLQGIVASPSGG